MHFINKAQKTYAKTDLMPSSGGLAFMVQGVLYKLPIKGHNQQSYLATKLKNHFN